MFRGRIGVWLRKNRVPLLALLVTLSSRPALAHVDLTGLWLAYSGDATLEEHFDTFLEPNGDTWLIVTTIITDPQYLNQPYATTNHFKKIPDASGWDPTP